MVKIVEMSVELFKTLREKEVSKLEIEELIQVFERERERERERRTKELAEKK